MTVPVRFYPHGGFGDRWIPTHSVPIEVPGWVTIEQSSAALVALGDGGAESSERWKLTSSPES